ncbi:hypothetical protein N7507_009661 [Penicillium longicatenatum]|nr:hypothetical protein N7507_009661 [Penicillium longicatenatum]
MDDIYVAEVLAKEARDSSQKYSTEGLGAYMSRKSASNAPKPNTRFLRHLIKETDNHNTALKRKEEREARERMRQLKEQPATATKSTARSSGQDPSRARDLERPRKEDREDRRRRQSRSISTERDRSRRHRRRDGYRERSREPDRDRTERRRERHRHHYSHKDRRDKDQFYSKSRSRSPRKERTSRSHRSERSRRSESPHRRSSHSHRAPRERERRFRDHDDKTSRQHRLSPRESSVDRKRKSPSSPILRPTEDDSDPLEDLVGPLPAKEAPIRSRGRGAYKINASNIDSHFASDYDPALDIQPDEDHEGTMQHASRRPVSGLMTADDDWDTAMEALRDRARWRQKGEERLRAAGIGEETIDRWKTESASAGVSGERHADDVRWSKKGEGREWDRGKFVDDDGHIDVRASWS